MTLSRTYKLAIETVGIIEEQLGKIAIEQFGWEGEADSYNKIVYFNGDGCLCGGMSEEEAHKQIYEAIKAVKSKAKVKTEWTCMENIPYEAYGDDIE